MAIPYLTEDGLLYAAEDGTRLVLDFMPSLITDRTAQDVEAVKLLATAIKAGTATEEQLDEYLNVQQKGAYTHNDMNRVADAVDHIADRLAEMGYMATAPVVRYWSVGYIPDREDFTLYFENVARIRSAVPVWASTPNAPTSVEGFDVIKANALEQILVDVYLVLERMADAWFFANDVYAAEV